MLRRAMIQDPFMPDCSRMLVEVRIDNDKIVKLRKTTSMKG